MSRRVLSYLLAGAIALGAPAAFASSHMDAPLISFDDPANTTDVYSFLTERDGKKYLQVSLGVYPFEEPGVGPNNYRFDDNVRYNIHVSTGKDVASGFPTWTYEFRFDTKFKNEATILQAFTGVVDRVDAPTQNLIQHYRVLKVQGKTGKTQLLGKALTPPNNQGIATPLYNRGDDGNNPAKNGVATAASLDPYTSQSIFELGRGYRVFAGQREDGFYGDINAIFDLLNLRPPGVAEDTQGGFNIHMIVLEIPVAELGGDQQVVGVWASTRRRTMTVLSRDDDGRNGGENGGRFVQVARQGNPLFNEGLVAIADKDLYSRTTPGKDAKLFRKYALNPELAVLLNAIVLEPDVPGIETNRTDIAGIFIPDVIKTDLSTGPVRLAGAGTAEYPDDPGFSRLSVFGGDTLVSKVQPGLDGAGAIPGGWPNGRRFGDDVVDIAVTALISDLRVSPPVVRGPAGDNVNGNDLAYSKVFPYAATPHNGRVHRHHNTTPAGGTTSAPARPAKSSSASK